MQPLRLPVGAGGGQTPRAPAGRISRRQRHRP